MDREIIRCRRRVVLGMTTPRQTFDQGPGEPVQVLDPDGNVVDGATVPDLDDETLVEMFREMKLTRHFDERAVSLQRQGRMGTYAPCAGQEGSQVGSTHALRDEDWIVYQYREHGAVAVRGFGPEYLLYWMGHEDGNAWLAEKNIMPLNITIGDQIPHATGMAWAAKLQGDDRVVACHFGDGATSEGDFHEGLNFAGVFDVPAVFFCNNNQWAISVPRERQTAAETLAQKATAYGFEGIQVDGMDPLAVYQVSSDAVEKARDPDEGQRRPTLIEAVQYRFGAHTTADDPTVYRAEEEVEKWRRRDPLIRMEAFLRETGRLDDESVEAIESAVEEQVADMIDTAESLVEREPANMFDHVFAELPDELTRQREYLMQLRDEYGDEALLEDE